MATSASVHEELEREREREREGEREKRERERGGSGRRGEMAERGEINVTHSSRAELSAASGQ